jgi:hypothetical protein
MMMLALMLTSFMDPSHGSGQGQRGLTHDCGVALSIPTLHSFSGVFNSVVMNLFVVSHWLHCSD